MPGVGSPQVVADTAVGVAVAGLGKQIGSSAGEFGDLSQLAIKHRRRNSPNAETVAVAEREKNWRRQKNKFERLKATENHDRQVHAKLPEERQKAGPAAVGLSEAMQAFIAANEARTFADLPDDQKEEFGREIASSNQLLAYDIAATEAADSEAYFVQGLQESGEFAVTMIRDKPGRFDVAMSRVVSLIDAAPLPRGTKAAILLQAEGKLAEAWVKSLPLEQQIKGLERLMIEHESDEVTSLSAVGSAASAVRSTGNASSSGNEVKASSMDFATFVERAQLIDPHTQNRLLAEAKKKQAIATVQEEQRIVALVTENPLAMNPREIHESAFLGALQKGRLLDDLQEQIRQQERNLEAVSWLGVSAAEPTHESSNQELADRAFAYLDDGETDRDALALGMLRNKGVLPDAYLKSLENTLNSSDPAEVGKAFDILPEIGKFDPNVVEGLRGHEQFRSGVEKQDILVNRLGFSLKETSADLAQGNDPVRRKDLRTDFAGQYPQGRTGRARAQGRLAHHSASGYGSSLFSVDELLIGVDFVERGGNSAGEI